MQVALTLATNQSLTTLHLTFLPQQLLKPLIRAIGYSTALLEVAIDELDDEGGLLMAEALEQTNTLRAVKLIASDGMSNATGKAIARAVKTHADLDVVRFDANSAHQLDDETGLLMVEVLEQSTTLKDFELRASRDMSNATGKAFARAVGTHAALSAFFFDASQADQMDDETGLLMAEGLEQNSTLDTVDLLASPGMSNATGKAVARAVGTHVGLSGLAFGAFSADQMDDETCVHMAKALEKNRMLSSFRISASDGMGNAGGDAAIAKAMKDHPALRTLALSNFPGVWGEKVLRAIEESVTLQSITVGGNNFDRITDRNCTIQAQSRAIAALAWFSETQLSGTWWKDSSAKNSSAFSSRPSAPSCQSISCWLALHWSQRVEPLQLRLHDKTGKHSHWKTRMLQNGGHRSPQASW